MKARFLTVIGAVAILAGSSASAANLVLNGSFEDVGAPFSDGGLELPLLSTDLTGWTIVGAEIAVLDNTKPYNLTPSVGNNFLDLTGYWNIDLPKGVSQTLTGLTSGQTYAFSMDLGLRNGYCVESDTDCSGPVSASVQIGGLPIKTFTFDSDVSGNVWGTHSFNFVADSSPMKLTILGTAMPTGNYYIGLDNVTVTAVPEPSAYAMALAGLGVVGLAARRRRRAVV